MPIAHLKEVNPILHVANIEDALRFYTEKLGFTLLFRDPSGPDNYLGVRRAGVELHMQRHAPEDLEGLCGFQLRFIVDDPDLLFAEYRSRAAFPDDVSVRDTPWGTREFAFYDLNRHALTFYRDL